jgi:hypothetical protein
VRDAKAARLERWALQSAARELLPTEAVSYCMRRVVPSPDGSKDGVGVWYSESVKKAHYKNLATCHSVWSCPICSAKITERRRVELTEAMERATGLRAVLATFTMHHDRRDDLSELLADLLEAYRAFQSGKGWTLITQSFGFVGSVRALEVTHWLNGWHPHLHVLMFFREGVDLSGLADALTDRWLASLAKRGRTADREHGLQISDRKGDVARYIQKFGHDPSPNRWTVEHELVKSPAKMGVGEHRTPMQLLRDYLHGDKRSGYLFKEYAQVLKGRHQLQWSRGLRKLLGLVKEATDQELAERSEQDAALLATLSLKQWRIILAHDARGEVLEVAHGGDAKKLLDFVNSLTGDLSMPVRASRAVCDETRLEELVNLDKARQHRIERNKFFASLGV